MKTKYINSLLFLVVNNSLKLVKKNSQIKFKKRYLELLNFLKKNNFLLFFKKINLDLVIYFKFFENLSIIKNIKIYNHLKKKTQLSLKQILTLKKNNKFFFLYILY
jgi:hypothetical protein